MDELWNELKKEFEKLGQTAGVDLPDQLKKTSGSLLEREALRLRAATLFLKAVNATKAKSGTASKKQEVSDAT